MADIRWRITYKGQEYEFDATEDLTAGNLRQMKRWFGQAYGQWTSILSLLAAGDVDAWASAIWICLKKAGGQKLPADPTYLNFSVGELMDGLEPLDADEPEDEESAMERPTSEMTPGSDEI